MILCRYDVTANTNWPFQVLFPWTVLSVNNASLGRDPGGAGQAENPLKRSLFVKGLLTAKAKLTVAAKLAPRSDQLSSTLRENE